MKHYFSLLFGITGILFFGAGCNVFDPLDTVSGDAQLLSAARACFDRGDLVCAKDHYDKLSSDQAEVAAAETAFVILDENGITMQAFMDSLGSFDAAKAINSLTQKLKDGAGSSKRLAIFGAYQKVSSINSNVPLRGLVRFVTSFALLSEIFSEKTESDGVLRKTDLVITPASCATSNCLGNANCGRPSSSKLSYGSQKDLLTNPSTVDLSGEPTIGMIQGAIGAIEQALTVEILAQGKFKSGIGQLFSDLLAASSAEACYRAALVNFGIGN